MNRQILHGWLIVLLLVAGCTKTVKPQIEAPQPSWFSWHQQWMGTRYRFGGDNQQGIDCSAYVQLGFRELYGIELPRTVKTQRKQGVPVLYTDLKSGDLVFFRTESYPQHVGVYLGDGIFTHVSSKKGVILSRLDKGYWHKRFLQGRRIIK